VFQIQQADINTIPRLAASNAATNKRYHTSLYLMEKGNTASNTLHFLTKTR